MFLHFLLIYFTMFMAIFTIGALQYGYPQIASFFIFFYFFQVFILFWEKEQIKKRKIIKNKNNLHQ